MLEPKTNRHANSLTPLVHVHGITASININLHCKKWFDILMIAHICNCGMVLRDNMRLVPCEAIFGQCKAHGVQQQLKFTLTKILALVKSDWPLCPHCGYPKFTLVSETLVV